MMVRSATDGTGNHSARIGGRRGSHLRPGRAAPPALEARDAHATLSGTGLPRRHGGVTPRSGTTFSRAPDSASKARLEFTSILPVRERNAGFHMSGHFDDDPVALGTHLSAPDVRVDHVHRTCSGVPRMRAIRAIVSRVDVVHSCVQVRRHRPMQTKRTNNDPIEPSNRRLIPGVVVVAPRRHRRGRGPTPEEGSDPRGLLRRPRRVRRRPRGRPRVGESLGGRMERRAD